jgi:hypothetical protein
MVTVMGASGNTGGRISELLLQQGEKTRALGRSAGKLARLESSGAEVLTGDAGKKTRHPSVRDGCYPIADCSWRCESTVSTAGIVVATPTATSVSPSARRFRADSLFDNSRPAPKPSAARVATIEANTGSGNSSVFMVLLPA